MKKKKIDYRKTKLRLGDPVIVIFGKNKGLTGKIDKFVKKYHKVIIEGVNIVKCHKKQSQTNKIAGIIEKPAPMELSNIAYIDPKTNKATRLGYKFIEGKKVRFTKSSNTVLN